MKKPKPYPYELATKAQRKIGSLWWCIHHKLMFEPLTEAIENRVKCIRTKKPEHEQETRLRAMRPVKGPLPKALVEANKRRVEECKRWYEADKRREKEYKRWDEAHKRWDRAFVVLRSKIEALFRMECPDVKWDNELVFPEETI